MNSPDPLADLYPPIEPRHTGRLRVRPPHVIHWEESGNPDGIAVIFVHGGPGAGTAPFCRRYFDPERYRVIIFDQRGAGRSRPFAEIADNTTQELVADMERLRAHLEVERWLVFGGSWGSTLALAYGQTHPERCLGFILRGVFLFRGFEVDWFLNGMGRFFPEAASAFLDFLPEDERADPLAAYYRRLTHADPSIHLAAARVWSNYEDACARLRPRPGDEGDGRSALALARLECHYMRHGGFLREGQLLAGIDRVRDLPCTIVQGRYDVVCPPVSAWELHRVWTGSKLVMVPDAGHSALEPGVRVALVQATRRFAESQG
ncbi:prolyl aminopeptidase [Rhodospirillum rubrum]|uniref:prolyl aminopeptidase n=1 Tax=Rhodospirillum rubrum TaxID=1085 RepID=UPI001905413B|nr:prolyl aminopeptidase [Rhodospirillum rubrum]MBK1665193.1 prolyl aminopeptidase [Rhodospirillum rubrum]MBK1677063.1 prolyl aminopeptidase [Rhodospirillum rubrum]